VGLVVSASLGEMEKPSHADALLGGETFPLYLCLGGRGVFG